ncbi:uncharacterized protein LOC125494792 [Beta vulgaris subsp. vulgaris]|uniref:uncharacterized protein LOC125494792 n=1 Tax=Beta vulgaris subsp. vulgaris TaxID=3555 RepID=UPI0020371BF2|nr:uncharacterized protein LOC125494792 [Beta vulgaris subsp. vulgaris]
MILFFRIKHLKFSEASGLAANMDKSNIYFCGVFEVTSRELAEIVHMQIGELPFTYLGVPLTSKKLSYAQSKPLVQKITNRAQTWIAHLLSYAGRLQLEVLWTDSTEDSRNAPIAWTTLQLPKSGGGWNIINMVYWNKAAMIKLLWLLSLKETSCGRNGSIHITLEDKECLLSI